MTFYVHQYSYDTATQQEEELDLECEVLAGGDVTYTQQLQEPLQPGSHLLCTGTPTADHPWFAINLGTGSVETGRADIAMHFNARVPQRYVVRNSRRNQVWGREETTAHRSFPFEVGRPFAIEAVLDEEGVQWAVDGSHYCGFAHRSPGGGALGATWVQVTGVPDATLRLSRTDRYPTLASLPPEVPTHADSDGGPEDAEPTTWGANVTATLSRGIPRGHQLVLRGRLRRLLHSFSVDLCAAEGVHEWPRGHVLLHANLRAHDDSSRPRQLVVLNSWLGSWGPERRQRSARFVPGAAVCLRVTSCPEAREWQVFADDVLLGSLEHRAPPELVRVLRVCGDLVAHHIYLTPL